MGSQLVNAWIFLNEDQPDGTNYDSANSCYQTLIRNNVYRSVDILNICFFRTTPTSGSTIPDGDGSSYTISTGNPPPQHPGGLTNEDYLNYVVRDSRENNRDIKILATLCWRDGNDIANIFSNSLHSPEKNADDFAANLVAFLKHYDLNGFDIDWEPPLSSTTTRTHFALFINAIGAQFKQQAKKHYLTLSPSEPGNLHTTAVNNNMDFVSLQLYSLFTFPEDFTNAGTNSNLFSYPDDFADPGINPKLFAYGAKFEAGFQTASEAYEDNKENYHYDIFTCWRLNSGNFEFEQTQQQLLYRMVFPAAERQ